MQPRKNVWTTDTPTTVQDSNRPVALQTSGIVPLENETLEKNICHWWLLDNLKYYCQYTCLHGCNFLVMDELNWIGRLFWIIIMFVAIITSIVLVCLTLDVGSDGATVTVIESTYYPTWNVPFPAVTICNFNKISKKKALEVAGRLKRPGNMTATQLANMFPLILHFDYPFQAPKESYTQLHQILTDNKYKIETLVDDISPTCDDMLLRCMFKGTQSRCDVLFQKVNSSDGICCSFNYLGMQKNNYPVKYTLLSTEYPQRVTACGYQTGLTVLLKPFEKDYFASSFLGAGFRILVHDSYDFPDENAMSKTVGSKSESFISLFPESMYATSDVRSLRLSQRGCFFYDEGTLETMKRYSYVNCIAECRSRIAFKMCGCIPLNLPNNGNLSICEMDNAYCISSIQNVLSSSLPGTTYAEYMKTNKRPCDCLPACELNQYPGDITHGILNREFSYSNMEFFRGIKLDDETVVHIYYNDLLATRYRTDVSQNWLSALASVGGILSLMVGFSILTTFELVYFVTLRPLLNYLSARCHK